MVTIFADNIFKYIFLQENYCIPISKDSIDHWHWIIIGLGKGMAPNMQQAITRINVYRDPDPHICVTRPQWFNQPILF